MLRSTASTHSEVVVLQGGRTDSWEDLWGNLGSNSDFWASVLYAQPLLSVQGEGLTTAQYVAEEAKLSVGSGEKCAPPGIFSE